MAIVVELDILEQESFGSLLLQYRGFPHMEVKMYKTNLLGEKSLQTSLWIFSNSEGYLEVSLYKVKHFHG